MQFKTDDTGCYSINTFTLYHSEYKRKSQAFMLSFSVQRYLPRYLYRSFVPYLQEKASRIQRISFPVTQTTSKRMGISVPRPVLYR